MKAIAGSIIMLASSLCLMAARGVQDTNFWAICTLFAGAHFIAGLFVCAAGIRSGGNKPQP